MRDGCRAGVAGMHVLMLSDVYFPRVNGVSTSIRAAIGWLLDAGHAVTLVAPCSVPVSPFAEASTVVVPEPSEKP